MADAVGQFLDIIDNRIEKHLDGNTYGYVRQRGAVVTEYDNDSKKAFVYFVDDESQTQYTFYNKTNELLSSGDNVKVYYVTNIAKGWIGERCGEPNIQNNKIEEKPPYISATVTNNNQINYNAIEKTILSVDFNVDGIDSDVIFSASQSHIVSAAGNIQYIYKIDGITNDFKPIEYCDVGNHISSLYLPINLALGKHNIMINILSNDGARGIISAKNLIGAVSGQISGINRITPPNEDLLLQLSNVEKGAEISLPFEYIYLLSETESEVMVDWGDGSNVETTTSRTLISHVYSDAGNYTITCKCAIKKFQDSYYPSVIWGTSTPWNNYLTSIRFPDNTTTISFRSILSDCPILETINCGNSIDMLYLSVKNDIRLTTLLLSNIIRHVGFKGLSTTALRSFTLPSTLKVICHNSEFDDSVSGNNSLTKLTIYNNDIFFTQTMYSEIDSGGDIWGSYASSCTALEEVVFGGAHAILGRNMFENCVSLSSVTFHSSVKSISLNNSCFNKCNKLKEIIFPESCTDMDIDVRAFYGTVFEEIILPDSAVIHIYSNAFSGSAAKYIYLPEGVTYIASDAFESCNAILKVKSGSYAEQFAIKNGRAYIVV